MRVVIKMKSLKLEYAKLYLKIELYYAGFCILIGLLVCINHGWFSALKATAYSFLFVQPAIAIFNRKVLLNIIKPKDF